MPKGDKYQKYKKILECANFQTTEESFLEIVKNAEQLAELIHQFKIRVKKQSKNKK